jgi:hypothetical protein
LQVGQRGGVDGTSIKVHEAPSSSFPAGGAIRNFKTKASIKLKAVTPSATIQP